MEHSHSATTVSRLLSAWQDEYKAWRKRPLSHQTYTDIWVNGVHFNDRLACLVVIGVRPDDVKEVIALKDGYQESIKSWSSRLRDLKQQGLSAPKLAIADGALGFWTDLRQVYPATAEQRCWVHKIANVLDKLPQRLQPRAKSQLHEIMFAAGKPTALAELARFPLRKKCAMPFLYVHFLAEGRGCAISENYTRAGSSSRLLAMRLIPVENEASGNFTQYIAELAF